MNKSQLDSLTNTLFAGRWMGLFRAPREVRPNSGTALVERAKNSGCEDSGTASFLGTIGPSQGNAALDSPLYVPKPAIVTFFLTDVKNT